MPRLFVAVDLPDKQQASLKSLRDETLSARWTPTENYHLTLRFAGDVGDDVRQMLEERLGDLQTEPISLQATGLDVFPSREHPRVLVTRFRRTPALMRLHDHVEAVAQQVGLDAETRSYKPHVTFARLKDAKLHAVRSFLRRHAEFSLAPFKVRSFHLYQSRLHTEGAHHEILKSYSL